MKTTCEQSSQSLERPANQSIKLGLQKIKQAQIEVMRELRKDDHDYSKNLSLTYSKQTNYDPKPAFRTDEEVFQLKNKLLKVQVGLPELSTKEIKPRQDLISLGDQVRKYKEAAQKAQIKMKEYEESEERALSKAQNAYSNAIASQKKYINLKGEFDKINKQKDRLSNELKKLQRKEISNLASNLQNEGNIPTKIIKQLLSAHECFKQLITKVNSHKCPKVSHESKNSSNVHANSTSNSFAISTFQIQNTLDKSMAKMIVFFKSLQSFGSIQQNLQNASSGVYGLLHSSNHYLSNSFQQDIKLIQEELQRGKGTNSIHEGDREQVGLLQNRIKSLIEENEENKELKSEFERFKIKARERELQKDLEIQIWKKQRIIEDSSRRSRNSDVDRNSSRNSIEILEDRLLDLEKQNTNLKERLQALNLREEKQLQTIQKLRFDLELTNATKQQLDTQLSSYETRTLNTNNNGRSSSPTFNSKTQHEWEEILDLVNQLQQEKEHFIQNQKKMNVLMEENNLKYQKVIQQMEQELKLLKKSIQQLQNTQQKPQVSQRESYNRVRTEQSQRRNSFGYQRANYESLNQKQGVFGQNNSGRQIKNGTQFQQLEQAPNRHYTHYLPIIQQHQQLQRVQQQQILNQLPSQSQNKMLISHEIMPNLYGHVQPYGGYPLHYQVQYPTMNQGMRVGNGVVR